MIEARIVAQPDFLTQDIVYLTCTRKEDDKMLLFLSVVAILSYKFGAIDKLQCSLDHTNIKNNFFLQPVCPFNFPFDCS